MPRLNQKFVSSIGEVERDTFFWDSDLKGFFVRARPGAAPAWGIRYRCNGKTRTVVIGPCHEVKAESARTRATEIKQSARLGRDIVAEVVAENVAPTIADLAREHQLLHCPPKIAEQTWRDRRTHWESHIIPALGKIRVKDLSRPDVEKFYFKIAKRQPSLANRLLATLSKAIGDSMTFIPPWRTDNPTTRIEKLPENRRERILSREELAALMAKLDELIAQDLTWWAAPYLFKGLLLSGLRLSELAKRTWNEIDLEAGTLFIPKAKNKKPRTVSLSREMIALLSSMPRRCDWAFPNTYLSGPFTGCHKRWSSVLQELGIEGVRLHDLRHTVASYAMHEGGLSQREVMELLGHSNMSTTERYLNVHDERKRAISDRASAAIFAQGLSGRSGS